MLVRLTKHQLRTQHQLSSHSVGELACVMIMSLKHMTRDVGVSLSHTPNP